MRSPALAEAAFTQAITAARWVIADEDGGCDEAARLLTEANIALTAAETAEIETQLTLIEAERVLIMRVSGPTDGVCGPAYRV